WTHHVRISDVPGKPCGDTARVRRSSDPCPCEARAPTWDERCDSLEELEPGPLHGAARERRRRAPAARSWLPPRDAGSQLVDAAITGRHARPGRACGDRPARPAVSAAWVALLSIAALLQ